MSKQSGRRKPSESKGSIPPKANERRSRERRKHKAVTDWAPRYLAALAETGYYARACEQAKVGKTTVWERRQSDAEFAAAEKKATDIATRDLVDEAVRRAKDGCQRIKFNPKTGEELIELEYSDQLLLRLLSARLPKEFGEKLDITGEVRHRRLTLDELKQRMAEAEA